MQTPPEAATKDIGNKSRREAGRWQKSRAKHSHPPLRRRERALLPSRRDQRADKAVRVDFPDRLRFCRNPAAAAAGHDHPFPDRSALMPLPLVLRSEVHLMAEVLQPRVWLPVRAK
jgi:hypothetical protein